MAQQTTETQRRAFYDEYMSGETYGEIAEQFGISIRCVGKWCRRQRSGGDCVTRQGNKQHAGPLMRFDPLVKYWILHFRLTHKRWGPQAILYHLRKHPSLQGKLLPSVATIGRYLHQWPCFHRHHVRKPVRPRLHQPTAVHEVWQIDFMMGIALADNSLVNLHTVRDPVGAACLQARLTLAGKRGRKPCRVRIEQLQETLRTTFVQWGTLPESIQTDGEGIFAGNPKENLPSYFTLWLLGLGIKHCIIRPGRPTDNAEVERCNQTIHDYAIVGNEQLTIDGLQQQLDRAVYELAYELPSHAHNCQGKPPVVAHPELLSCPRPYARCSELEHFDMQAVDTYLATFSWRRSVSKKGQINMGGHNMRYSVGRCYAGQIVQVKFDPTDRSFVFYSVPPQPDLPSNELGRRPARGFSAQDITNLPTVSRATSTRTVRSRSA